MSRNLSRFFEKWLWGLPFLALPLFPELFGTAALFVASYLWFIRREKPIWLGFFVTQMLVWSLAHVLSQKPLEHPVLPWVSNIQATTNLIPSHGWVNIHGWSEVDGGGPPAQRQPDGYWRVSRSHPVTKRLFGEFLSSQTYPLEADQPYTLSFYFRHDGHKLKFDFSFYTSSQHQLVPAQIIDLGDGLYRAYATYRPDKPEQVRVPDIVNLQGDWSYLDIAYVQLEPAETANAYVPYQSTFQEWLKGLSWTVGTPLLGIASLQTGRFLLTRIGSYGAACFLLAGLAAQTIYGLYQYATYEAPFERRVSGYAPNPNLLGHAGIVTALLVSLLGGIRLGFWAILMSGMLTFISGSRAALLGWMTTVVALGIGTFRRIPFYSVILVACLVFLLLISQLNRLMGLLSNLTDQTRWVIWQTLWPAVDANPLFGLGIGNIPAYFLLNRPNEMLEINLPHAHNAYLQLLVELGLLGFAGFALVWIWAIYVLWQHRAWGALLVIASIALMNLFDYSWYYAGVHYGLWIAVAWGVFIQPDKIAK